MAVAATWNINLQGDKYRVEVEHNLISGRRVVRVNDKVYLEGSKFFDFGSKHTFQVGSHQFLVRIKASSMPVKYELVVDGLSYGDKSLSVPRWVWLFIIPVIVTIPLASGGGAINSGIRGGIAGAGFGLSYTVAAIHSLHPAVRFILCIIVTAIFCGVAIAMKQGLI